MFDQTSQQISEGHIHWPPFELSASFLSTATSVPHTTDLLVYAKTLTCIIGASLTPVKKKI